MFTEGLDESAIKWVKKESRTDQQIRSPMMQKEDYDLHSGSRLWNTKPFLTPHALPPLKFQSSFLSPHAARDTDSDEDDKTAGSVPNGYSDYDEGNGSCDSGLSEKLAFKIIDDDSEAQSARNFAQESYSRSKASLVRGISKENIRIEVPQRETRMTDSELYSGQYSRSGHEFHTPRSYLPVLQDLGTPSAPPMGDVRIDESRLEFEDDHAIRSHSDQASSRAIPEHPFTNISKESNKYEEAFIDSRTQSSERSTDLYTRSVSTRKEHQLRQEHGSAVDHQVQYSSRTFCNSRNAWQMLIAYDACFRLCLNAWARDSMEAPEFLRDECAVLRHAFGLQKYLLQPRGCRLSGSAETSEKMDERRTMKKKRMTGKIRVEVRKIRLIHRRKLKSASSQRGIRHMEFGTEYIHRVSTMLKTGLNSIRIPILSVTSGESLICLLQLRTSSEEMRVESSSAICLRPGTGDSHLFSHEGQGDLLVIEVQDSGGVTQGRSIIQVSSLTDNSGDGVRWWSVYDNDQECVGKVQLSVSTTSICDETNPVKSGPIVETMAYDMVLEAALRAQHFHSRNLRLSGSWKWLLIEFADYYGVTDAYTKLRHLSYVMDVATPTKGCLELLFELLAPVVKAGAENCLTRQEKSILQDMEAQVENLLAKIFADYKSLDENSPTGLMEKRSDTPLESAATILVPAMQLYTLLHDILSQEAQLTLQIYLQPISR